MEFDISYYTFLVRWGHVLSGVMWIGLAVSLMRC